VLVVNRDLPSIRRRSWFDYAQGSSGRAELRLVRAGDLGSPGGRAIHARDRHQDGQLPYKGGGVALTDLRAGITQVMFPQLPAAIALATAGDVKPLAVTSRYRLPQLPDVPTLRRDIAARLHVSSWTVCWRPRDCPTISVRP